MIASFLADERSHIACFTRLRALTGLARTFFQPPWRVAVLGGLAGRWPLGFPFWTDAVAAFEEYALDIGKHYREDETLDPLFRDVSSPMHAMRRAIAALMRCCRPGWRRAVS